MKLVLTIIVILTMSRLNAQGKNINFNLVKPDSNNYVISTFRCYISGINIQYSNGEKYIEENSFHLMDMEHPESFHINLPKAPSDEVASVLFLIGTDSLTNVAGILEGDLDPIKGMYWTWNSGYINFKLEGEKVLDSGKIAFEYHIGGYLAPFETVREVEYNVANQEMITININLDDFLEKMDFSTLPNVMSPGVKASEIADQFVTAFSIENE